MKEFMYLITGDWTGPYQSHVALTLHAALRVISKPFRFLSLLSKLLMTFSQSFVFFLRKQNKGSFKAATEYLEGD